MPTSSQPESEADGFPFMVDTEPHIVWDHAAQEKNIAYLAGVDPGFFEHVARVHAPLLSSEDRQERHRAATAIRLAYSMALETFCAMLAACVQAPRFPLGWMLAYNAGHLKSVMEKLYNGEDVHNAWGTTTSWQIVADTLLRFTTDDPGRDEVVRAAYANMWKRFARDFLDDAAMMEYNSIKHGARTRSGGFHLSVGHAIVGDSAPSPEAMTRPSGSTFGSQFFVRRRTTRKRAFTVDHVARNWIPDNLLDSVQLLTLSITNLLAFLRRQAGDNENAPSFVGPADLRELEVPWMHRLEFESFTKASTVRPDQIGEWTDDEVRTRFPPRAATE